MSIETVSGVVVKFSTKNKNYSVQLDDGNWYSGWLDRYKNSAPAGVAQDAFVEIKFKMNGTFRNIEPKGGIIVKEAPATQAGSGAADSKATTGGAYAEKDMKRQREIRWHSSRNAAIQHVSLVLEAGSLDFGKAKAGEKMDVITALVDNFTEQFYLDAERVSDEGFVLELPEGIEVAR